MDAPPQRRWAAALVASGWWLAGCGDDAPPPGAGPAGHAAAPGRRQPARPRRTPPRRPPSRPMPARTGRRQRRPASGDAPGPDGPAPTSMISLYEVPAPIAAACQRYAEVQCARWKACTPARFAADYNSDEICRARREAACRTDFLVGGPRARPPTDRHGLRRRRSRR